MKIDGVDQKPSAQEREREGLGDQLRDRRGKTVRHVEKSIAALHAARAFDRVCRLLMSGALLGVMARALGDRATIVVESDRGAECGLGA